MTRKTALRVCPYHTRTFNSVRWLACNFLGSTICDHHSCTLGGAPTLKRSWGSYYIQKRHYITMAHTHKWPDASEVKQLLDAYNVPICPHLSLGQEFVLNAYRPHEQVFGNRCSYCDTHFQFRLAGCTYDREIPGSKCLDIFVRRNLGALQLHTDPIWLSQLSISQEPGLTNYWLNCIILSQDYELDKRKRIHRNTPCGDKKRCRFKAEIKESENRLNARSINTRYEIDSLSGRLLRAPFGNHLDYALSLKDKILYKPLWAPPGTTWYGHFHPTL